jgi:hypothetical protein
LADLKSVSAIDPSRLAAFAESLAKLDPPAMRPIDLVSEAAKHVGHSEVEPLIRQLISLHGLMRSADATSEDVFEALRKAVEMEASDSGLLLKDWVVVADQLRQLVDTKSVRLAATAIELAYDYANLLRKSKILTDIRPIYNPGAETIEAAVVSFTLRIHFDSADGEHELSIACDKSDVDALAEQCDRALRKASAARDLLATDRQLPTLIAGEFSDD